MDEKTIKKWDKYSIAVAILLTAAILFISIPLILNLTEYITAAFVIAAIIYIILGGFVIMFTGNEPIDPHLVGILMVQECINQWRLASDAGIKGNAYFLPPRFTNEPRVMQFNPVSKYSGGRISAKGSFLLEEPRGLLTIPSSDLLLQSLRKRNALVVTNRKEELTILLSETISEVLEFAPRISTEWDDDTVAITLHGFQFLDGCLLARSESPGCCPRYPCPACSLCGVLLAEGLGRIVALDRCSLNTTSGDVTADFSILPLPEGEH